MSVLLESLIPLSIAAYTSYRVTPRRAVYHGKHWRKVN
jgi:hypothetical protein